MKLDCVTITGADDSIEPEALLPITEKYPFVEWGILFSGKQQGTARYPSYNWLGRLKTVAPNIPRLCAHLCGQWVRELVLSGKGTWWDRYQDLASCFRRIQLNFHGQYHKAGEGFVGELRRLGNHEFIFQHDGVNDSLISTFTNTPRLRVFPLFDRSGGAGIVPKEWPKPIWKYQGYAGGLGPENIVDEIKRIGDAVGNSRIWIDMETRVRSEDDLKFDLSKVERCLEAAAPFVIRYSQCSPGNCVCGGCVM